MHDQVWVKVNAPADSGIAPLISALSQIPHLQTLESCEGGRNRPGWLSFRYGKSWKNPWKDLAWFALEYLGPQLAKELGDRVHVSVGVSANGMPQGELTIRPGALEKTLSVVRRLLLSGPPARPAN